MTLNLTANMFFDNKSLDTIAILLTAIILWLVYANLKFSLGLPPGPRGLPYFGYLPFLGTKSHITLTEMRKKYGDIFMFHIYNERIVIISSFQLIKDVLASKIFEEHPESFRKATTFTSAEPAIFGSYGATRVEFRRFVLSSLRNFGMGKSSLEVKIQDEIHYLIEELEKLKGQPIDIRPFLTTSITNIIYAILFGKRMNCSDQDFQQFIKAGKDYLNGLGIDQWTNYLPQFLINILRIQTTNDLGDIFCKQIMDQITNYDKNEYSTNNPDNFINTWRAEREKSNEKKMLFSEKRLAQIIGELFSAGSDTTSVSLEWILLYLIKYPEIQKKVQIEIDNVIGRNRAPAMSDQKLMPFTEATILEVMRIMTIVPLPSAHCSSEDTKLNGYRIPKNTSIWCNIWALHLEPEIFPEPEKFMPERFLTEDYKLQNIKEVMPFTVGRRQCLGEGLARMTLFLYLVSLLQHFNLTKDDDVILDCHYYIVLEPERQKIRANLRN